MTTYSLSGSGTHALTASTTGLEVTITTPSTIGGLGRSNPVARYDQGLIRFSDGTGYWPPVAILGGPQFVPVPANATSIGYALLGGAVVSITEVIGGTVFFSGGGSATLSGLTDVLVASPANGQLLQWNASAGKWENTTPAVGAAAPLSAVMAADVALTTIGNWYNGPNLVLSAGLWLVEVGVCTQCGGSTGINWRLSDGTNVAGLTSYQTSGTDASIDAGKLFLQVTGTPTITLQASPTWTGCTLKRYASPTGLVAWGAFLVATELP